MNFLIIIWRKKYEYWVISTYYFVYYSYLNFHILRRSHLKKNGKQFSVEDSNDKMCVGLCVVFRVPWFKNEGLTLFPLSWVNQSFSKVTHLQVHRQICYAPSPNLPLLYLSSSTLVFSSALINVKKEIQDKQIWFVRHCQV